MTLEDFFNKEFRKKEKLIIPQLELFSEQQHAYWSIKDHTFDLTAYKANREDFIELTLEDYFEKIHSTNALSFHSTIVDFFENHNSFIDGLPIFIIRRHGSRSGELGAKLRRRGWLVRFYNAWIVYADNFLTRHFFEASYLVDNYSADQLSYLINSFSIPLSSGGGRFEKIHRAFPSITHLSSRSGFYLSHISDLNQSEYVINNRQIAAQDILGRGIDGKFGCGTIQDWEQGQPLDAIGRIRYRVNRSFLSDDELLFLKVYNIRMLSPLNYFPFPKKSILLKSEVDGESMKIRMLCKRFYSQKFQTNFDF